MAKFKNFSNITLTILICAAAIICGIITGQTINSKHFPLNSFLNIDPTTLRDDVTKISYKDKTPDKLSGVEAYLVSYNILSECQYYKKTNTGNVDTSLGVKQYIDVISIKEDDTYHQEYLAYSSLIKMAGKITFKKGDDIIVTNGNANSNSLNDVEWTSSTDNYSYQEYSELIGRDPTDESIYIASSKTILSETPCSFSNNLYTFSISLDPNLSTLCYRNEVAFNAGMSAKDFSFNSIKITFTVDENFRILSQETNEEYTMKYAGIGVTVYANYKINFEY